jgi:hypothetical protein
MITLLIVLTLAATVGLLALRYGYDSRDGLHSQEEQFAAHGMSWLHRSDEQLAKELADGLRRARERRAVGRLVDERLPVPQQPRAERLEMA